MTPRRPSPPSSRVDERVDFLIIGSGIGGLWTALKLADHGRVLVVTKKDEAESNTNYAQGGIAAVMSQVDSINQHIADTIAVGGELSHPKVVRRIVAAGPGLVNDLIDAGVQFTYTSRKHTMNTLDLGLEGGHSAPRVVHSADLTGQEIEASLLHGLSEHPNAEMYVHHLAIDLMLGPNDGQRACVGAIVFDRLRRIIRRISSPVTILATGGSGQVYRHTTNPMIATGDGLAMACRAGAVMGNLEFVQFHPTRLYHPRAQRFLISEAVRGAGGILRNRHGEAFMERYHPKRDLAPRDIVARAIVAEARRTGSRCAWLDLTHLRPAFVRERFPNIYKRCLKLDMNITREPIPVVPAAHYMCGGVATDLNAKTNIPGLWVAGEAAHSGLHGANRLASNSLLEAMFLASQAAESAARAMPRMRKHLPAKPPAKRLPPIGRVHQRHTGWKRLQKTMWDDVGIIRDRKGLSRATKILRELRREAEKRFRQQGINANTVEYRNATLVGYLISRSALAREESRGLHYRLDFPLPDDAHWKQDSELKGPVR
ncbi:MAG: L-aspartate oxidase [candidate division Zixibacteria bacterium]|nr:L-aspartate oxidase [candidate division Zixibacteria bacterium]